ncbi:ATP-dependent DNA helicase [Flavimobilis rhizosphaerae]|nr:ATP-dependent DNA helicase [Flavimobilis rhizosphaerae]
MTPTPDDPETDVAREVGPLLEVAVAALGGSPREGQRTMAERVATSFATGEHLLVQAGTGTGKSLGYLVPAVHHAVTAGERVVVSTATLALQRQVLTRDLPLVADALTDHLPRAPRIALLKGWQNYLCLHKVAGGYPEEPGTALFDLPDAASTPDPLDDDGPRDESAVKRLGREVVRLREWSEQTTTGDRDDLVPGVSARAWRQVSVTKMECLGNRCPLVEECFPERARAHAREADVVVTNHAMLGIAASGSPGVLPEHSALVVDEAHELTDRITSQATLELSTMSIDQAARLARRQGIATAALDRAAADLGALLMDLPEGRFPHGLPEGVQAAVGAVRDEARELLTALKPEPKSDADGALKVAQAGVLILFETAERMAADPSGHDVLWCSRGSWEAGGATRLHVAPMSVSGLVRTSLLAERTGVFTSATLSLGGSFEHVARSLGLETPDGDGPATPWDGIDVGTPFDYAKQGILYVARHLPAPGREPATEAQLDTIAELVEAAGGRTLGLFSSRRAAETVAAAMRERLDVPVLCQGDDVLPTLVRQFAEDEATCLFGTLSLWQGVDVPGRSCSLVLIDRIPFPRPDDPVRSARTEAVAAAGGNGFMSVSATHAALLLAQGAGRLVRTSTDRGVVAVLDSRLATARYGSFLTRSMPPLWPTTDRAVVLAALRRLTADASDD